MECVVNPLFIVSLEWAMIIELKIEIILLNCNLITQSKALLHLHNQYSLSKICLFVVFQLLVCLSYCCIVFAVVLSFISNSVWNNYWTSMDIGALIYSTLEIFNATTISTAVSILTYSERAPHKNGNMRGKSTGREINEWSQGSC